jgi:glucose/mannose-6-phosphate isomerase
MYGAISVAKQYVEKNEAAQMAKKITNKIPILVASEHLVGAVHVTKNQINESAKSFSALFEIPELNHHLMEGLGHPETAKQLMFLLYESSLYADHVQKRYPLTKEVIEKNGVAVETYRLESDTRLQQVLEVLVYGSFLQYHLATEYNADPLSIPWVDYFKERLA